ncbi:MAG: histidine kinase [Bacteroidetes bacterium]|nr:histidine kinase [Bacteroidota bacterium]
MKATVQFFFLAWWVVWTVIQMFVMNYYGISFRESWMDASVTSSLMVGAGYLMIKIVGYFRPSAKNALIILIEAAALTAMCGLASSWILKSIPSSLEYTSWFELTFPVRMVFIWLMIVIAGIDGWLFSYMKEQQQNEHRTKETEKLMREAELTNLQRQLQPHFLFNSLNSISALTVAQPEQARKMIEQLSDFLRGTVKKENNQFTTLRHELHHLQLYLDIEKVRFGHRLSTAIEADNAALEMKLPSLLLQPVLENAIKFGLYDTVGNVVIRLVAKPDNNNLLLEIKNPFDADTAAPKTGTGFGLQSVQKRLSLLFFRNDLLSTEKKENIFITHIKVPQL